MEESEEEFIRKLFLPRNDSIDGFNEENEEEGLGSTEHLLKNAEKRFLGTTHQVRSPDLSLEEIALRFSQNKVPEDSSQVNAYMDSLVSNAVQDSVNTASPGMIGHMTSSLPYFMRPLSRLVTSMNQNCVKTETANTMTFLEREAMAQLHEKIYHLSTDFYQDMSQSSQNVLGVFTSGGTLANVTALWVARNVALGPKHDFKGVEQTGVFEALVFHGYKGMTIIGSELLHYSMAKAADLLGIGLNSLHSIPFDEEYRVQVNLVEQAIQECRENHIFVVAILGIAGATETGSIDDLDKLADLAERYNVHFHVDAAWGGPCVFSRKYGGLLKGIERCDSVTVDGHKQLYMPMGCGLCFFRDPESCLSIQKTAKYIIRKDSFDLGKFTLEGSRPANAVFLHSNLNILGSRGYEILVDRSIRMTRYMATRIGEHKDTFEIIADPALNILLYRCLPKDPSKDIDEFNTEIQHIQTFQGRTFVSRTTIRHPKSKSPVVALRVVIANPLTFEADIDRVLQNQMEIVADLEKTDIHHYPRFHASPVEVSPAKKEEPSYWQRYWKRMPRQVKLLFKDDMQVFLSSLVAPELPLEDLDGLFSNKS